MKELKVKWSDIVEDEAIHLASSLESLKKLRLDCELFNEEGVRALSAAIEHMENPVKFVLKKIFGTYDNNVPSINLGIVNFQELRLFTTFLSQLFSSFEGFCFLW